MKYYTVVARLDGPLSGAVAIEWTNLAVPVDSGQGWHPCLRLANGAWRFSSNDPFGPVQPHRRDPGVFDDLAIRYRLSAAGPWSAASQARKYIVILEVAEGEDDPLPTAPFAAVPPALAGSGRIGTEVAARPGLWGAYPAPQIGFQWRRDGADIAGAVTRAYVPIPADDLTDLDCAVTASNAAGAVVAVTAALPVTYPAPAVFGELPEEIFDEGTGPQLVETGFVFTGENLSFAATGRVIDPETGVLTVSTDAPVSGETVTITATNSGGAASASLQITVEATPPLEEPAPRALVAADIAIARSVWRPEGQIAVFTPIVAFPGLAGKTVDAIEWTTAEAATPPESAWEIVTPKSGAPGRFDLFMRDPAKRAPLAVPKVDYAVFGLNASEIQRRGRLRFRWRETAGGLWSAPSVAVFAPEAVGLADIPAQTVVRSTTTILDVAAYATGQGLTWRLDVTPAADWIAIGAATGLLTIAEPNDLVYPAHRSVTVTVANATVTASRTFPLEIQSGDFSDADRKWRQVYYRTQKVAELPVDHPQYYPLGPLWGEGFQIGQVFEREGDQIYFGGDMCGFRRSPDAGRRWYWPQSNGLRGCVFHAIGVEPSDTNRVLVAVSAQGFDDQNGISVLGSPGLYLTTDGGRTFTLVQAMNKLTSRLTASVSPIVCWRANGVTPATRRWRFAAFSEGKILPVFWKSDAGGAAGTWSQGGVIPAALDNAVVHGLAHHPGNANWLYMWTSNGLWRTTDDGANWVRLAETTLTGRIDSVWIEPESVALTGTPTAILGATRMLCSHGGSLMWSTDGGASWSARLAAASTTVGVVNVAVGPKDAAGRRTIYATNADAAHRKPWIQHWSTTAAPATTKYAGGGSGGVNHLPVGAAAPNGQWFLPVVVRAPGETGGHWGGMCIRQTKFLPSATNPNDCAAFGYALPWRTEDRGTTWIVANAGFGGMNSQSMAFSADHPNWAHFSLNDLNGVITENFPMWFEGAGLQSALKTALIARLGSKGVHGVASMIVPDHAGVPVAKRGRIVAASGSYLSDQCLYRKDRLAGGGWGAWVELTDVLETVKEIYNSAANPNVIYAGSRRSIDAGDAFVADALGRRRACGVSNQDPGVVFAVSAGNTTVERSASFGNTDAAVSIKPPGASAVAGAPWVLWYRGTRNLDSRTSFWVNPFDAAKAICQSNAGDLVLLEEGLETAWSAGTYGKEARRSRNGTNWRSTANGNTTTPGAQGALWEDAGVARIKLELDIRAEYLARGFTFNPPFPLSYSNWDATHPRRFYAICKIFGAPMIWRGMFDADYTAIVWEDITRNCARTANSREVKVHPATGDVYMSNGGGIWVLPASGPVHGKSVWPFLPKPFPQDGSY